MIANSLSVANQFYLLRTMRGCSIRACEDLLIEAVSSPALIFTAFMTGYTANPCYRTALPSVNVDAPKANPLIAEGTKSHDLEGKDVVLTSATGAINTMHT